MANPYIELYKKKQKEDQGSQQTAQQTQQTQKQTQSTTGNPYIDLYNQRQQQPKPSQPQPTVYEQRKARQEKASENAKKAWWEVLGLAAQDASAAATGQQRMLTAEEGRQRAEAGANLNAAIKENREANKVIEWDGRKELLKEYRRLDEIDNPKARQEAEAIREQLRQGDIKAGNLDADGDMAYNVGDWSSNVVPGAAKNVGSAIYNTALTAGDLYAKSEAMKGPTEDEIITEYLTGQEIGSTAKMRQQAYNGPKFREFMNKRYAEADRLAASAQRNLQIAKENQAPIVKAGTDVAENMLEMGFDGGVAMLTGGSALIPMAARVFGSSSMEARQAGASLEQQALYGLSSAALEVATEKLGDGLGGLYGKGFTQNATEHMIQRLASTDPGRTFLRFISGLNSEGMEEVISGVFEPALKSIYNGKTPWQNYSEFEWGDLLYDYALGAAAAIFGGASNIVNGGNAYANAQLRAADAAQAQTDSNFGWMLHDSVKEQAQGEQFDRMFISGTPNTPVRNAVPAQKPEMKEAKTPAQRRVEAIINAASTQDQLVQSLQFFQSKPELDAAFEELTGGDIDAYLAEASQEAAGGAVPQEGNPAPATPENAQQQAPGEFNSVNEADESGERTEGAVNPFTVWPNMNYNRIAEAQNRNMRDASGSAVDSITGDLYNHNERPYRQFKGELHPKQLEWSAGATQQQYGYAEPNSTDNGRRQTDQYNSTIQTAIEQVREDGTNANRIMEGVGEWRDVDPQVRADIMNHIDPRGDYYVSEDKASGGKVVVKAASRLESETNERSDNFYDQEMRDAGVEEISPQEIRNGALANSEARLETRYDDSYIPSEKRSSAAATVYTDEELAAIDKYNRRRDAQKHRENYEKWLTEHNIDPGKEPVRNPRLGEPRIEIRSAWMQRTMRDKKLLGDLVNGTGIFKQFSAANRLDALRTMYPDANWQFDASTNTITLPGDKAKGKTSPFSSWEREKKGETSNAKSGPEKAGAGLEGTRSRGLDSRTSLREINEVPQLGLESAKGNVPNLSRVGHQRHGRLRTRLSDLGFTIHDRNKLTGLGKRLSDLCRDVAPECPVTFFSSDGVARNADTMKVFRYGPIFECKVNDRSAGVFIDLSTVEAVAKREGCTPEAAVMHDIGHYYIEESGVDPADIVSAFINKSTAHDKATIAVFNAANAMAKSRFGKTTDQLTPEQSGVVWNELICDGFGAVDRCFKSGPIYAQTQFLPFVKFVRNFFNNTDFKNAQANQNATSAGNTNSFSVPDDLSLDHVNRLIQELDENADLNLYETDSPFELPGGREYNERREELLAIRDRLQAEQRQQEQRDRDSRYDRVARSGTLDEVNELIDEVEREIYDMDMGDEVRADKWSGDEDFRPDFNSDSGYYKHLNELYGTLRERQAKLQRGDYRLGPKAAARLDAEAHASAPTIDPYDDGGIDVDADDFELPYRTDNKEMQRREDLNRQSDAEERQQPRPKNPEPESSAEFIQQTRLRKNDFENRETERAGINAQFREEEAKAREEIEHDEAYERAQTEARHLADAKKAYGEENQKKLSELAEKGWSLVGNSRVTENGNVGFTYRNEGGRDLESFAHVLREFAAGKQTFQQYAEAYRKLGSEVREGNGRYFFDENFGKDFETLAYAFEKGDVIRKDGALDPDFANHVANLTQRVVHRMEMKQKQLKLRSDLAEAFSGDNKTLHGKTAMLVKAFKALNRSQLRPSTAFKMLASYDRKNGRAWYQLADKARDSVRDYINTFQTAQDYLQEVTQRKDWEKFSTGKITVKNVVPGLDYEGGRLSANAAVSFLKMLETNGAYDHIIRNGIIEMPYSEAESYKGQMNNGLGDTSGYSKQFDPISPEVRSRLETAKTAKERTAAREQAVAELDSIKAALRAEIEAVPVAKAAYGASFAPLNFLKKALNKTSRKVWGADVAVQDKYYWPLEAGGKRLGGELLNSQSYGLDQYRNVQERTGDRGGLMVRPFTDVMQNYIRSASHWAAYQELSDTLNTLSKNFSGTDSITQLLNNTVGKEWSGWLSDYEADLNGTRGKDKGFAGKALGTLRGNLAQASLSLNPGVALKQAPSGLNFIGVLDADIVTKRFFGGALRTRRNIENNPLIQAVQDRTRMLANRGSGYNIVEGGEATEMGRKNWITKVTNKLPNWITATDYRTVANGLLACADQVDRYIKQGADGYAGLTKGSDAYYSKIADLFERATIDTQPIYNKEYRADLLRTDNEFIRTLAMFRTQQTQNYNNLVESVGEWNAAKRSGDAEAIKAAGKKMAGTIGGQVASAIIFSVLDAAAKMMLHKKKQYEDEDGNLDWGLMATKTGYNTLNTLASTSFIASKLSPWMLDMATTMLNKKNPAIPKSGMYYSTEDGVLSLVDDMLTAAKSFTEKPSAKTAKSLALAVASISGMPLRNAYGIVNTIAMYGIDATGLNVKNEDDLVNYLDGYYNATDSSKGKHAMLRAISLNKKGNGERVDAIMASLEPDALKSANQQLKDSFIAGEIDAKTYRDWLRKYFGANSQEVLKLLHSAEDAKTFNGVENNVKANVGEKAYEQFTKSMSKLNGTTDPTGKERLDLISGLGLTENESDIYVQKFMPKEYSGNYEALRSIGFKPNRAQAVLANIDADSGGTITQEEVYSWLLDNSQDKRVANALWEAKGWSTSLDKYAESYAKNPVNILVSFGMDKQQATRVSKQLNYDGKNSVTQEDFFNYLKQHPDQEEALKAVFAVKWPKSNYESKKRKYS